MLVKQGKEVHHDEGEREIDAHRCGVGIEIPRSPINIVEIVESIRGVKKKRPVEVTLKPTVICQNIMKDNRESKTDYHYRTDCFQFVSTVRAHRFAHNRNPRKITAAIRRVLSATDILSSPKRQLSTMISGMLPL